MSKFTPARFSSAMFTLLVVGLFQVKAATISWTNTAGGNWNATNNWSPNTVPGAADTALITNAGTYAVSINVNATVSGLNVGAASGTQTVNVASTILTLNGASTFATNTAFNLSGGTLDGTGTAVFAGSFTWSGGVMDSTTAGGKTVFTNSATVNYPGDNFQAGGNGG